jgi:hypothetical protein
VRLHLYNNVAELRQIRGAIPIVQKDIDRRCGVAWQHTVSSTTKVVILATLLAAATHSTVILRRPCEARASKDGCAVEFVATRRSTTRWCGSPEYRDRGSSCAGCCG